MTDRKQTPDVLGEILGGEISEGIEESIAEELAAAGESEQPSKARRAQPRSSKRQQTRRRRTSKPAEKQKWEYLLVSFQEHRGWRPRYTNGQEVADWMDGPVIHDYVGQLGEEGWELISASAGQRMYGLTDVRQLYFKRPKN